MSAVVVLPARRGPERRVRDKGAPAREIQRAGIVLLAADGAPAERTAAIVGCAEPTVGIWRGRYAERGLVDLKDLPQRGEASPVGAIASHGTPVPIQVRKRWMVERTNSWLNDFGRLRRCAERRQACIDAHYPGHGRGHRHPPCPAAAAWYIYRWNTRSRSPRIR